MALRSTVLCTAFIAVINCMHVACKSRHPPELTHVKPGLLVGALTYHRPNGGKATQRSLAGPGYQGQKLRAVSLGQYLIKLKLNSYIVEAVVDTGSGNNQLACTGVRGDPSYSQQFQTYDPSKAVPPFKSALSTSTICKTFCNSTLSVNGCLKAPTKPGTCEYRNAYSDGAFVYARVYSAALSFPKTTNLPAPASISNFVFGCSFEASTDPYFYLQTSALFGFDWTPSSVWSQMISSKLTADTMYLCMGNGGDSFNTTQDGVLVLGGDKAVSVRGASKGGEVITIKLMDPSKFTGNTSGQPRLYPPSAWVLLTSLKIEPSPRTNTKDKVEGSWELVDPSGPRYYLIDTGSAALALTPYEWRLFDPWFCYSMSSYSCVVECVDFFSSSSGYFVTLDKVYSPAALDTLLPPITMSFMNGTRAVQFKPSSYMVYNGPNGFTGQPSYSVVIVRSSFINTGILGNAWLSGWLIQQTRSSLQLKMTRVKTCSDVVY